MNGIGPAAWSEKFRVIKICSSKLMMSCLEMRLYSYEGSKASILLKEGEIGCSSLAAMSMTVAPRANRLGTGLPCWRAMLR